MQFLVKCPQCGTMIASDSTCPNCRYSGNQPKAEEDSSKVEEYQRRQKLHVRNYTIFMALALLTGLVGLYTAYLWLRAIYLGDVGAFLQIGVMTVVAAILGALTAYTKKRFSYEVHCPSCNTRLDELGLNEGRCPACDVRLS